MIATMFDVKKDPYYIEGVEKGIEKGIEKGEMKKSYEFAMRLIENKYEDTQIFNLTNLDIQRIKELRQKYTELGLNAYQWIEEQFLK